MRGDCSAKCILENRIACSLYFYVFYGKINATGGVIFVRISVIKKWLRLAIKSYVFYYEPGALFHSVLCCKKSPRLWLLFCDKLETTVETILVLYREKEINSRCASILSQMR
jgi:hypothetical protein